jgi:hypothetical protein
MGNDTGVGCGVGEDFTAGIFTEVLALEDGLEQYASNSIRVASRIDNLLDLGKEKSASNWFRDFRVRGP